MRAKGGGCGSGTVVCGHIDCGVQFFLVLEHGLTSYQDVSRYKGW